MISRHGLILFSFVMVAAAVAEDSTVVTAPAPDKRAFGVFPNNRTTEASFPFQPITARRKMTIAVKDSFAAPLILTSGVFASVYQIENQNPSFGQGMAGYAKRYG